MEKNPPIKAEEIHLLQVEVTQNQLDVVAFKKTEKPRFAMRHQLMHNLEDERIKLELVFNFKNQAEQRLFLLQLEFHFKIENLKDFYELKDDETPVFNGMMIATLLGIALSTSRGIIFEKLENNGIKNILIPVVSPHQLLNRNPAEK